ncbi:uncharacterized protein H6S33_005152 [Morchella sextelata]|uniref:uncharacterized protein n=1 Tax=Morchella sextelata TaxID=1174677 RepID=UPI001D037CB8|nr:uncharacterized protein H6S33_005152 [Morchella sextelata]KAH0605170.1 hypothetical protein H6S33_005152 [Morchella sextelata]
MKLLPSLLLLAPACLAREKSVDEAAHARYASGDVMAEIMAQKEATWQHYRDEGYFKPGRYRSSNGFYPCVDGSVTVGDGANSTFQCLNLDVTGYLTHEDLGSTNATERIGSSIWGITLEGREFAIIGQADGTAFAEVVGKGWWNYVPYIGKKEGTLDYIGRLPQHSVPIIWREIKTYKHYAIIGSEAVGHGIQIFDLRNLLEVRTWWNRLSTATKTFDIVKDVVGHFDKLPVGRSHNVVIAEASQHIIAVGAQPRDDTCRSGLIFIDVSDPSNPTQTGCAASDGYVHDAQCLIYRGPDTRYNGVEICYGYNEDSLTIYNITDKADAQIISRISYEGASYTHQGWVLDPENQEFLLMDDELDEQKKAGAAADQRATTYIWNIANLEKPILTGTYKSDVVSIDHNQYVHKGFSYQSNYGAGMRILDVQGIPSDPTGGNIKEVAFIDIFPDDDAAPAATFMGTWGSYGFFESGHIIINTYDRGVFVVKRSKEVVGGFRAEF